MVVLCVAENRLAGRGEEMTGRSKRGETVSPKSTLEQMGNKKMLEGGLFFFFWGGGVQ